MFYVRFLPDGFISDVGSNLIFPLAHLNILISAELSLFSSFFFTAQHSEPYVIAGLMIVLKTLGQDYKRFSSMDWCSTHNLCSEMT